VHEDKNRPLILTELKKQPKPKNQPPPQPKHGTRHHSHTHPHKQNSNPKPTPTNTVSDQQTVAEELQKLEKLGFDSMLMGSATYNHKIIQQTGTQAIITILLALSEHYGGIRCRLANTTNPYPKHQELADKIAGYTSTELAEALKRLSFANQTKTYLFWKNIT
jgi:hypothetical protein